ncbi:MAG: hypothetical protein H6978_06480 [Gammaproteobacteria bacterium]|nr:hypothetical protein [Gammaproteobacteria bacterium]
MIDVPLTQRRLVVQTSAMSAITIEYDRPYGRTANPDCCFDIYRPSTGNGELLPGVVFVSGYPDAPGEALFGCKLKQWRCYCDWARLLASHGLVALTYSNQQPWRDACGLLDHISNNAAALGIDPNRIGLWACSGNGPVAWALMDRFNQLRCAALCYPYISDLPGHDEVARAATQFGFEVPRTEPWQSQSPLLLCRAGEDAMPGLNASLDRFITLARPNHWPVELLDVPNADHAFDTAQPDAAACTAVAAIAEFFLKNLCR